MYIRDLNRCRYSSGSFDSRNWSVPLLAVGWLEFPFPFRRGAVSSGFLAHLKSLVDAAPSEWSFRGLHQCSLWRHRRGFLDRPVITSSHKNVFLPGGSAVYIASGGIIHYVEDHRYLPPSQFIEAVMSCPDFSSFEYRKAIRAANAGVPPALRVLKAAHGELR